MCGAALSETSIHSRSALNRMAHFNISASYLHYRLTCSYTLQKLIISAIPVYTQSGNLICINESDVHEIIPYHLFLCPRCLDGLWSEERDSTFTFRSGHVMPAAMHKKLWKLSWLIVAN